MYKKIVLFLLGVLTFAGCKDPECPEERIACYVNGKWEGDLCPSTEAPVCGCSNQRGELIEDKFDLPCKNYSLVNGENPVNIKEPYEAKGCHAFPNQICVDFAAQGLNRGLYFDYTIQSNDEFYRPVYVNFGINGYEIEKYHYKIKITDEKTNMVISSAMINQENISLRNLEFVPKACTGSDCILYGTMSMNINNLSLDSSQPIIGLYKTPLDEDGVPAQIDELIFSTTFRKFNEDVQYASVDRAIEITAYETARHKMGNYVTGEGLDYLDALEKTFGDGTSNIGFGIHLGGNLPKRFVHNNFQSYQSTFDLMVLDKDFFRDPDNPLAEELRTAVHDWVKQVFERSFPEIENVGHINSLSQAFSIEVDYFNLYNVTGAEPVATTNPEVFMANLLKIGKGTASGVTYIDPRNQYIGIVVLALNNLQSEMTTLERPSRGAFSLSTWLHEIGHVWSSKGYGSGEGSDCDEHTHHCSGYNEKFCLWRTSCPYDTEAEKNLYYLQKANNPTFCERHQYIFMNGLTIRN